MLSPYTRKTGTPGTTECPRSSFLVLVTFSQVVAALVRDMPNQLGHLQPSGAERVHSVTCFEAHAVQLLRPCDDPHQSTDHGHLPLVHEVQSVLLESCNDPDHFTGHAPVEHSSSVPSDTDVTRYSWNCSFVMASYGL